MRNSVGRGSRVKRASRSALAGTTALVVGALAWPVPAGPAHAGIVSGSACAYRSSVSLFGGPATVRGCGQTIPPGDAGSASTEVTLPPGGSTTPVVAVDPDGARALYGPATLFGGRFIQEPAGQNTVPPSGPLTAQTVGTATVRSVATANAVGPQPFYARSVVGACTAGTWGKTLTAQLVDAFVVTTTDFFGNPRTTVAVPRLPPVNYTVPFTINNVGDHGTLVFNERLDNPDGSTTVNAVHMYLQGPTAIGDMVIGQARCGR
jgi:hypothetical protein